MRDNFLCDAKVSQFGLLVWCANLAAFFCTLSNALICPSLYRSQYAASYARIGRTNLAALGVDSRVFVWVQEFLLSRSQRVRLGGQLSEEAKWRQGYHKGAHWALFGSSHVLMIFWGTLESTVRLFADDCTIYRKITDGRGTGKSQIGLDRLWNWEVENEMKVNPS